jgi:MoxR-like ATPase
MRYRKIFDPQLVSRPDGPPAADGTTGAGDRSDGSVYVYTEPLILAVNVALATGRPLLVGGRPGAGKSSLAPNVARVLRWPYYVDVISSRTQARDLLWRFDNLRRLNDAQAEQIKANEEYIEPGVLWQAFDAASAQRYQRSSATPAAQAAPQGAVALLDEIDKADPDMPNDLLVPLGSFTFRVTDTDPPTEVSAKQPVLLIITTNDERELSAAFLRRCVIVTLDAPSEDRLVSIAEAHYGPGHIALYRNMAKRIDDAQKQKEGKKQSLPSTAEFLDAINACIELQVTPDDSDETWTTIAKATLWKPRGLIAPSS